MSPFRHHLGLSPRVRGNPLFSAVRDSWYRSIPARAGEPTIKRLDRCFEKVYPRACGGTSVRFSQRGIGPGLSPRVRGNRDHPPRHLPRQGSIPARAGEPEAEGDDQ